MTNYSWGAHDLSAPAPKKLRQVPISMGLLLEDVDSGWVGEVVRTEKSGGMRVIVLEDRRGKTRSFQAGFGFLLEGEPVEIVEPQAKALAPKTMVSASGSRAVTGLKAREARASRIWVEGKHDAELVEKVWGHDLRVEGIVVEPLHGVDDLAGAIRAFNPSPERRLGILVDHLIAGTKEERIVKEAMAVPGAANHVLILGHPYVDVWQAVKPAALNIEKWPVIPRGTDWKTGILRAFGWPHSTAEDIGLGWQRILSRVDHYAQLEPQLLGKVEELIDFLTSEDYGFLTID
ncbi:hypothetical protein CQ010_04680 [Arthrobacter sp. MYb211]|uniref:DUF3097 domain-containing protein n=1 Tax=Micrococcaceae TaxID=1268 RepID=UPI000CFBC9D6|nr:MULTISPECIES: DUF3097 domain-containing protein [unclassified Arthrobacter]PRA01134.1 hypothetical protein CQ017_01100 [Arthrobacter sp. MYb224]PRA13845.1 hypothetical protein CQ015_00675 [Arthrobacter sp. MYb221]PRC09215.1 hypothetical protein CQ010_04680 [Arthrobacter sp. MYb211]